VEGNYDEDHFAFCFSYCSWKLIPMVKFGNNIDFCYFYGSGLGEIAFFQYLLVSFYIVMVNAFGFPQALY
jgi:hypothetical protein